MLVRYFTQVRAPHWHVEATFSNLAGELTGSAETAYREGEELRHKLQPIDVAPAKEVLLRVGTARIRRDGVAYPITWRATGPTALFPRMTAELVVSPVGSAECSLVFEGTYDPPLGILGEAIDRTLLNRLAEMTVKSWVDDIVRRAEERWVELQREGDLDDGPLVGSRSDRDASA